MEAAAAPDPSPSSESGLSDDGPTATPPSLPLDILYHTFELLDARQLSAAACASRAWRDLATAAGPASRAGGREALIQGALAAAWKSGRPRARLLAAALAPPATQPPLAPASSPCCRVALEFITACAGFGDGSVKVWSLDLLQDAAARMHGHARNSPSSFRKLRAPFPGAPSPVVGLCLDEHKLVAAWRGGAGMWTTASLGPHGSGSGGGGNPGSAGAADNDGPPPQASRLFRPPAPIAGCTMADSHLLLALASGGGLPGSSDAPGALAHASRSPCSLLLYDLYTGGLASMHRLPSDAPPRGPCSLCPAQASAVGGGGEVIAVASGAHVYFLGDPRARDILEVRAKLVETRVVYVLRLLRAVWLPSQPSLAILHRHLFSFRASRFAFPPTALCYWQMPALVPSFSTLGLGPESKAPVLEARQPVPPRGPGTAPAPALLPAAAPVPAPSAPSTSTGPRLACGLRGTRSQPPIRAQP